MATTSVEERPTPFPPAPAVPGPPAQEVRLCLLGSWRLLPPDGAPVPPNGQRLLAVLALLGRQSRAHVAATLWPDIDDERASGRLRSLLWRLDRRVVELIDVASGAIGLREGVRVDLTELIALTGDLIKGTDADTDLDRALTLLDGPELLVGWYDEWALRERDLLNQRRLHALEALVDRFIDQRRPREALHAARLATNLDPYRETAHRAMIRALLAEGNRASALRHLERYRSFVRAELGIDQLSDEMQATIGSLVDAATRT
jgi:DNA-binding SARP family transcriptional activator